MFELKRDNIHRLVSTKEEVDLYLLEGYILLEKNTVVTNSESNKDNVPNFDSMGYTELKDLAKQSKIKGYTSMKKNELVDALKANL